MLVGSETLINIKFTFQVEIAWQILETYIFGATEAVKKIIIKFYWIFLKTPECLEGRVFSATSKTFQTAFHVKIRFIETFWGSVLPLLDYYKWQKSLTFLGNVLDTTPFKALMNLLWTLSWWRSIWFLTST